MTAPFSENLVYFSLGSNLGDRKGNLELAMQRLGEHTGIIKDASKIYESNSWGYSSKNAFYNCCIGIRTTLNPLVLMETVLRIERELGRIRNGKGYSDRIIDIDLLLYGDLVMDHPGLVLPIPRMAERGFVLVPLAEIAPDLVHPVSGLTIKTLMERCPDKSEIMPF